MIDGFHGMWGMHWGWWIFWIALILIVAWSIVRAGIVLPREGNAPQPPSRETGTPLDILQRRYAAGEMSTDEYEERKAHLEEHA